MLVSLLNDHVEGIPNGSAGKHAIDKIKVRVYK